MILLYFNIFFAEHICFVSLANNVLFVVCQLFFYVTFKIVHGTLNNVCLSCLPGLVGVGVKQKLLQNVPRCNQMARSLMQLHRKDPSTWLTYQHLNFLKRQVIVSGDIFYLLMDLKKK